MKNKNKTIVITSMAWMVIIGMGLLYKANKNELEDVKYINEKIQAASIQNAVEKIEGEDKIFLLDFKRSSLDNNFEFIGNYATNCVKTIYTTGTYKNDEIKFSSLKVKEKKSK